MQIHMQLCQSQSKTQIKRFSEVPFVKIYERNNPTCNFHSLSFIIDHDHYQRLLSPATVLSQVFEEGVPRLRGEGLWMWCCDTAFIPACAIKGRVP